MQHNKSRVPKVLLLSLKIILAILLVWWLWRSGKLNWNAITNVHASWALAGMVLFQILMIGTLTWRWNLLLKTAGTTLPFGSSLLITLMAQCTSTFTPGSLGIDGTRFYHLYTIFPKQRAAASVSIIWDRLLGIGALLFLTVICNGILLFFPLPITLKSTFTVVLVGSIILLALPLTFLFPHNPLHKLRRWKLLQNIPLSPANKSTFILPSVLAYGTHFCNALSLICAFYAMGFPVPLGKSLLLMPLVILSGMLPLTPLGLGVTDAVALVIFNSIHISSGANAVMLARISFVAISALCGLAWFVPLHQNNSSPANHEN
ncbi:MAG: lysylphosphatidylglycerol synthase transmembrane domain-containing protein [Abditibacteriaceae bacterium]